MPSGGVAAHPVLVGDQRRAVVGPGGGEFAGQYVGAALFIVLPRPLGINCVQQAQCMIDTVNRLWQEGEWT